MLADETLERPSYPEGVSITLECDDLYDKASGTGRATCTGGEWSEPDLVCTSESPSRYSVKVKVASRLPLTWGCFHATEKDCGAPPSRPHMIFDLSGGTTVGARIQVSCEEG